MVYMKMEITTRLLYVESIVCNRVAQRDDDLYRFSIGVLYGIGETYYYIFFNYKYVVYKVHCKQ